MNPIARMMKRYIKTPLKYALPLLFIGALVLVSISGCTSPATISPSPSASSVPTATPIATATPKATPTATPTSTPSAATPTARPTDSEVAAAVSGMEAQGYTVVTPFTYQGNFTTGDPMYTGTLAKNGYNEDTTLVKAASQSDAQTDLQAFVTTAQALGFTGSYTSSTAWSGAQITSSGTAMAYNIGITDSNWVMSMVTSQS